MSREEETRPTECPNHDGSDSAGLLRFGKLALICAGLAGLGLNLWLLLFTVSDDGLAGCGGGGCEEVLSSRWASIFGIPVTAFGLGAYLLVLACVPHCLRWVRQFVAGAIAGAAVWFVLLQLFVLKSLCPWCMAAHAVAFTLLGLEVFSQAGTWRKNAVQVLMFGALMAFLFLMPIPLFSPAPPTYRLEGASGEDAANPRRDQRWVTFHGGRLRYDVLESPRLGSHQAKRVLVEYFDYQCATCKIMSGYLDALMRQHPDDVAVLVLPVPLDRACNSHVRGLSHYPESCEITRIALAIWRVKPEVFPSFHRALLEDASLSKARNMALEHMTEEEMKVALADPWIEKSIHSHIATWHEISASSSKLPKLLIRDRRVLHGLPSGEADFIRVMEQELGL